LAFLDKAIADEGWKMVLILRLIPLIPFSLLNYVLTVTNIDWLTYIICTFFGMLPRGMVYVYIGISAGSIADIVAGNIKGDQWWVNLIVYGSAGFFIFVGLILVLIVARKYFNKYKESHKDQFKEEEEEITQEKNEKTSLITNVAVEDENFQQV
jgi:uncharacterized membrane protein YdjX (TVP38/TMEM64 family)